MVGQHHRHMSGLVAIVAAWTATQAWSPTDAQAAEPGWAPPDAPPLTVRVDPRVELMSVIFRLAGSAEYNQGRVVSYVADVDAWFGPFRNHDAIETARRLRRERGVSYDAVMSMAIHVTDPAGDDPLAEMIAFDPHPVGLDDRWPLADARIFLAQARDFARVTGFQAFLRDHADLYEIAESRARTLLREEARLDWFGSFFGAKPGASFTVALGLLNGGACYGPRVVHTGGREDLYCVLGVWMTDTEGLPRFDASVLGTVAHEFCHSYANPLVDANLDGLRSAGETLYPFVEDAMRQQAYGDWRTMMRESLVRACVVRYVDATQGEAAARREDDEQRARSFHWVPALAELLAEWEADRGPGDDFASFMPRVVAFFREAAPRFEKEHTARAGHAPRVVEMTPVNGAQDVDPALSAIVVVFDRPMTDGNWSFVGGGPHFPLATGPPSYDESRTRLTLPVQLKPEWTYEFWLNRGRFDSFRSSDGIPLEPVHVTFATRSRRADPNR